MFVRIWEYEVPEAHLDPFIGVCSRRSLGRTVRSRWKSFLKEFQIAYRALDIQLEGLASSERPLFEGNS